ncbi:MAG: glycoside hydrolase family 99-like domain-containing protein [Acidimicrobiales bacterium]|jgi:hypothetical protein
MEVLALYLPQFHPIPENDRWWGKGFTEWTNVTKAVPLFRGHVQPHLPADLGFYDLRVAEVREAQADLARSHGVTGFCYWHYWFAGRQLLQRPLDEVLATGAPDFPFCVSWANQSWSGIWHGAPNRVLMEQTYPGPDDDAEHFAHLAAAFEDPRYIRIGGRPLLFVYQPGNLPEPARFVDRWQKMAHDAGLGGLYLVASLGEATYLGGASYRSHVGDGFDAAVYFQFPFGRDGTTRVRERLLARGLVHGPMRYPYPEVTAGPPPDLEGRLFPAIYPNWDNTPRLGRRGIVATGSTPERFGRHARRAIELASINPDDEQVVVIKSWNEWAEGNYLEPDAEYGLGRLEALRTELARPRGARASS